MSQSLAKVLVHIVFSTKGRHPWLKDEILRQGLFAYQATLLRENVDSPALLINGADDHVHALCQLPRKFAIKDVVEQTKTESTKWLKKQGPQFAEFHWQSGYGIFSVSESKVEQVTQYIANQARHHQAMTFQDEFRLLCQRHKVALDERYVWD